MPRGGKRPGAGRKRGQPSAFNAKTRADLWEYIEKKSAEGYIANPFQVLVDMMVDSNESRVKIQCASELADRLMPKLKAVEHTGEMSMTHRLEDLAQMSDSELRQIVASRNGHVD